MADVIRPVDHVRLALRPRSQTSQLALTALMPDMDGLEATQVIRQREQGVRCRPIVAVTAHAMRGDRERCLDAGMDGFLSKPIRHQELFAVVDAYDPARCA